MLTVGLTGSYATGKTKVADMFKQFGAEVVCADKIAHRLMLPKTVVWKKIIKNFGSEIIGQRNLIDRKKLGKIVFFNKKLLKKLNALVHPQIKAEIKKIIKGKTIKGRTKILILEIPLLFEAGTKNWFNRIIVVTCSKENQYKRAFRRENITKNDFLKRLKNQWPLSRKIKLADFIVDNNGSMAKTKKQVHGIWEEIIKEVDKKKKN
jgi:dephospho-CoA kinase